MKSSGTKRGGARLGAGRKKGSLTKRTQEIVAAATADGLTPLEYLLGRLKDEKEDAKVRLYCAKEAAPYIHPKLSSIEHSGGLDLGLSKYSDDELEAAIRQAATEAKIVIGAARKGVEEKPV